MSLRSERRNNQGILTWLSVGFIMGYRKIAPLHLRAACRFIPTCSEYAIQAIMKYGFWKGWGKTIKRLIRCRPPYGGFDYP